MKILNMDVSELEIMQEYGLNKENTKNVFSAAYEEGERLMDMNEPLVNLLILSRGAVKVCAEAANGRNLILCYYVQHGILGDMELLSGYHHIASTVIAVSPVRAAALPYAENRELLENNPVFMKHLARDLALKLMNSSRNYASAVLDSAEQRLARYINESSRNHLFSEVMSDVSMSTGMSYRHMYRILDNLCQKGILQKTDRGWLIQDENGLKKIEEGILK